jgi:hypothetical protein
MQAALRHLALMCSLSALVACASTRLATPEATLEALAHALEAGDAQAAHALLAASAQARVSPSHIERQLRENPKELEALLRALRSPGTVRTRAVIALDDGSHAELELDATGRWVLSAPLTDFYPQDTPRAALASFVRAVELERWDVLLELMPEADRADLTAEALGENLTAQREELTRLVALLKTALDEPIEIVGDRATLTYGESYTARLVLENARWKIEDPA